MGKDVRVKSCIVFSMFLHRSSEESCGAKKGFGNRTTLWGLQYLGPCGFASFAFFLNQLVLVRRPPLRAASTLLRVQASDHVGGYWIQIPVAG